MSNRIFSLLATLSLAVLPVAAPAQVFVDLGSATTFGVLAGSAVSSSGNTTVNGDLASWPTAAVSGFGPGVVNGTMAGPAAAELAQGALATAYGMVTGQSATVTGITGFTNQTLTPAVYNSTGSISITGTITLDGNGLNNSVFIFQMSTTLLTGNGSQILLTNGAQAANVFWQVGSSATLGDSTTFAGSILAQTSISSGDGTVVDGRFLAMDGAVTMINNTISVPTAIPEPATTTLMFAGGAGLALWARKLRRKYLQSGPGVC